MPKIDELRDIAKNTNASIIGITESKLDSSVTNNELKINNYTLIRKDRNRHGGGVACYINNNLNFTEKPILQDNIEYILLDIFLQNTKPFTVGIFYRPPDKYNFLEELNNEFYKLDSSNNDIFILGDFNINLLSKKNKYILDKNNIITCPLTKLYKTFLVSFGLTQILRQPTRITCNSSSLIDHILTNAQNKISQSGIIDLGISDHQLIYCTRKVTRNNSGKTKFIKLRSMKNYNKEDFVSKLNSINYPDYETFGDVNKGYANFIMHLRNTIDKCAPLKEVKVKNNSQEWYDGEIKDKICTRNKLYKKFTKSKLQIDKNIFIQARNDVRNLIKAKKKRFVDNKLKENVSKSKELWKTLKDLGLESKSSNSEQPNVCLKDKNGNLKFHPKDTSNIFKSFFSNLAMNLLDKLPNAPNKFTKETTTSYYNKNYTFPQDKFKFQLVSEKEIENILENLNNKKSSGIDNITMNFLKDGSTVLTKHITKLCNLSISTSTFS